MRTAQILSLDLEGANDGRPDHLYYVNTLNGYWENSENRMYRIAVPLDPGGGPSLPHPILKPKSAYGLELRGDDGCGRFGDIFLDDEGEESFQNDFVRARFSLSIEPWGSPDRETKYGNRESRDLAPLKIYQQQQKYEWKERNKTGIEKFVAHHTGLEVIDLDGDDDLDVVDANYNLLPCYLIKNRVINKVVSCVVEPPQSSALPCDVTVEVRYLDGTVQEEALHFLDLVGPQERVFSLGSDSRVHWIRVSYPEQAIEVFHVPSGTTVYFYPDGQYNMEESGHGYGFRGIRSGEEKGIR